MRSLLTSQEGETLLTDPEGNRLAAQGLQRASVKWKANIAAILGVTADATSSDSGDLELSGVGELWRVKVL